MALSASVSAMAVVSGSSATKAASSSDMYICMHGLTSIGFDFRTVMEDTPALPHLEVAERKGRAFPGEGVALLQRIVGKLAEKGYSRALSLELFDPVVQNTDPKVVARKGIETITPYIS